MIACACFFHVYFEIFSGRAVCLGTVEQYYQGIVKIMSRKLLQVRKAGRYLGHSKTANRCAKPKL